MEDDDPKRKTEVLFYCTCMNFDNMPKLHTKYGYFALRAIMIVVALGDGFLFQETEVVVTINDFLIIFQ